MCVSHDACVRCLETLAELLRAAFPTMALEEVWTPRIPPASLLIEEGDETMLAGAFWGSTPPQVPWMGNPGAEAMSGRRLAPGSQASPKL